MRFRLRLIGRVLWTIVVVSLLRLVGRRLHPSWSWRAEILARMARWGARRAARAPISRVRAAMPDAPIGRSLARRVSVEPTRLDALVAETTTPSGWTDGHGTMLYFHGGGYAICSIGTHRQLVARLAVACGVRVVSVAYRLAPENPFPAAVDDAWAAYRALLRSGTDPSAIVLGGDSAGGGLCMAILLRAKAQAEPRPAAAVLLSPWVDLQAQGPSFEDHAPFDYLNRGLVDRYAAYYLDGASPDHPWASPARADLRGLPPLLVHSGGAEVMHSQHARFVETARAADVRVEFHVGPAMLHAWHGFAAIVPEGRAAIRHVGSFVRSVLR